MEKRDKIAVYPGTFDPITYGHIDIITRASSIFSKLIVAVAKNSHKDPVFTIEERVSFLKNSLDHLDNVVIDSFDELLINYLKKVKADVIIRGMRVVTDFDYEFAFAAMNKKLAPEIDTIFLMTSEKYSFISSTLVKEVVRFGGDVSGYVPEIVIENLRKKLNR
ncbi:MAG: pantetheine-phosphate adenylyltransferase [bacterium]|nr:pantetheine-phosphate adenylyltransferase [bacterium]